MPKRKKMRRKSCNLATPIKYPKHLFKRGDIVVVIHSVYSGVTIGDKGIVECLLRPGYGVAFTKTWPATVINEKNPYGKRVLFFEHGEIT